MYKLLLNIHSFIPPVLFKFLCSFFIVDKSNYKIFIGDSDNRIFVHNDIIQNCVIDHKIQPELFFAVQQHFLLKKLCLNKTIDYNHLVNNIDIKLIEVSLSNPNNIQLFHLDILIVSIIDPKLLIKLYDAFMDINERMKKTSLFSGLLTISVVTIFKDFIENENTPFIVLKKMEEHMGLVESNILKEKIYAHPNNNVAKEILLQIDNNKD